MRNGTKAVIFDFDQVIIKSYEDHANAIMIIGKKFRIKIKKSEIYKRFGISAKEILRQVAPELPEKNVKKFLNEKEELYRKMIKKSGVSLVPGVKEVLNYLKNKNIKLAIASSASIVNINIALKKTKIKKYFPVVVAGEHTKRHKPYPDPLLKATKKLKVHPKNCIYIGDSIYEMIAAKRARMLPVGLLTGIYSEKDLRKNGAKFVIKNLAEMKKIT